MQEKRTSNIKSSKINRCFFIIFTTVFYYEYDSNSHLLAMTVVIVYKMEFTGCNKVSSKWLWLSVAANAGAATQSSRTAQSAREMVFLSSFFIGLFLL